MDNHIDNIPDRAGIGGLSIAAMVYQRSIMEMVHQMTDANQLRLAYIAVESMIEGKQHGKT